MKTYLVTIKAFGRESVDRVMAQTEGDAIALQLAALGVQIGAKEVATTLTDRVKAGDTRVREAFTEVLDAFKPKCMVCQDEGCEFCPRV